MDDRHFRRVAGAGEEIAHQAAADSQGGMGGEAIEAAGIGGQNALAGGIEAVDKTRDAHLAAVGMAADCQV